MREVEDERDAVDRAACGEQPLELDGERPALATRTSRAATSRPTRAAPRASRRGRAPTGPPCRTRLGSRHGHDEIGLDERGGDADRPSRDRAELDEVLALDVVDDQPAAEAAAELGRDEQPDLAWRGPPAEAARDEDRHVAPRRAARAPRRSRRSPPARGSGAHEGTGRFGSSITTVAEPPGVTSDASGGPASGNRSASRVADADARSARPSAAAGAARRRRPGRRRPRSWRPERSGIRVTAAERR